jgi:hypothetical protein
MPEKRQALTRGQWEAARHRWEHHDRPGFDWLAKEMAAAFGLHVIRQTVSVRATREGWEKVDGGTSEPLNAPGGPAAAVAQQDDDVAQQSLGVAQHGAPALRHSGKASRPPAEVADEVVDASGAKPPGYLGTGRPAKYRPEFDRLLVQFFDKEPWDERTIERNGVTITTRVATDPPMLATFARSIGVSLDSVNRWATEADETGRPRYPGFAEAYARARGLHEAMLARAALVGDYDPKTVQFVLKNLYSWEDQPARTVEVAPVSIDQLQTLFVERMNAARARTAAMMEERRRLRAEGGE